NNPRPLQTREYPGWTVALVTSTDGETSSTAVLLLEPACHRLAALESGRCAFAAHRSFEGLVRKEACVCPSYVDHWFARPAVPRCARTPSCIGKAPSWTTPTGATSAAPWAPSPGMIWDRAAAGPPG